MSKNEKDNIFKEAMNESLSKMVEEKESEVIENKEETIAIIKERLEEGDTQWDLLKRMIDGSMTEKFIKILHEMGDRDYARNYLKLLEHFKPKITRTEGSETGKPDLTINIQTVVVNSKGEKEVIPLNQIKKEDEL